MALMVGHEDDVGAPRSMKVCGWGSRFSLGFEVQGWVGFRFSLGVSRLRVSALCFGVRG